MTDIIQWLAIFVLLVSAVFLAWQVASLSDRAKRMEAVVTKQKIELDNAKRKIKAAAEVDAPPDDGTMRSAARLKKAASPPGAEDARSGRVEREAGKRAASSREAARVKAGKGTAGRKAPAAGARIMRSQRLKDAYQRHEGFAVFAGSYSSAETARAERNRLLAAGFPATAYPRGGAWAVTVGPFESIADAERYYSALRRFDPSRACGVIRQGRR